MKNNYLKFVFLLISVSLLAYGWSMKNINFSIAGAVLYIMILCISTVFVMRISRKFRDNNFENEKNSKTIFQQVTVTIEGVILISGLIMCLFQENMYKVPGMIIWFGSIGIYIICGILIKSITNIPLKMGYGGWFIPHSKNK